MKELEKAFMLLYLEDENYEGLSAILGIMEINEVKELFTAYDAQIDRVLQLNERSLKQIKLDKFRKQTRWIAVLRSIEVDSFSILVDILGGYISDK